MRESFKVLPALNFAAREAEISIVSPVFGLRYFLRGHHQTEAWPDQMFIAHLFDHELYGAYEATVKDAGGWTELPPTA